MRKILLVNGKKRSGKDYFSDMLIDKDFIKLSIATSLKDIACRIAGIDYDTMEELKNDGESFIVTLKDFQERFTKEVREIWKELYSENKIYISLIETDISTLDIFIPNQGYGPPEVDARKFLQNMNIFKIIFNDDNIWINMTLNEIKKSDKDIVIADFRFPNEYYAVDKAFADSAIISSIKVIGKNIYDKDEYDKHISEISLNDWRFDYHINNTFWHSGSLFWQTQGLLQTLDMEK